MSAFHVNHDVKYDSPSSGGVRRAELESYRERALQALGVHFASSDLDVDELDRRMGMVMKAESRAEIDAQLSDLAPLTPFVEQGFEPSWQRVVAVTDVPPRGVVAAAMGGAQRKGRWLVPRHMKVWAFMGGVDLDFRQARFAPGVTEIEVTAIMGGVEIIVPPDITVEWTGVAVMGGFETETGDATALDPDRPIIRLSGMVCMGGVEAKVRKVSSRKLAKFRKRLTKLRGGE